MGRKPEIHRRTAPLHFILCRFMGSNEKEMVIGDRVYGTTMLDYC